MLLRLKTLVITSTEYPVNIPDTTKSPQYHHHYIHYNQNTNQSRCLYRCHFPSSSVFPSFTVSVCFINSSLTLFSFCIACTGLYLCLDISNPFLRGILNSINTAFCTKPVLTDRFKGISRRMGIIS